MHWICWFGELFSAGDPADADSALLCRRRDRDGGRQHQLHPPGQRRHHHDTGDERRAGGDDRGDQWQREPGADRPAADPGGLPTPRHTMHSVLCCAVLVSFSDLIRSFCRISWPRRRALLRSRRPASRAMAPTSRTGPPPTAAAAMALHTGPAMVTNPLNPARAPLLPACPDWQGRWGRRWRWRWWVRHVQIDLLWDSNTLFSFSHPPGSLFSCPS